MNTTNKRILITGATGKIGSALCKHLFSKDYDLILTARSENNLCNLSVELKNKKKGIIDFASADFRDPSSFLNLYQKCSLGIDGLVLIMPKIKPSADCLPSDECWINLFKENFIGPLALIRELMPFLTIKNKSKVVILSGISSLQVLSHYSHSNAIRAAWVAQAKTLAFAFGAKGVHFNTISIGGVMTDDFIAKLESEASVNGLTYDEVLAGRVDNVPLKKYASLFDIAHVVEGLLANFSDHITGNNIICDGGFTRAY